MGAICNAICFTVTTDVVLQYGRLEVIFDSLISLRCPNRLYINGARLARGFRMHIVKEMSYAFNCINVYMFV
jgi:hypothetical protein